MVASYKFLQKLWTLHNKIKKKVEDKKISGNPGKIWISLQIN